MRATRRACVVAGASGNRTRSESEVAQKKKGSGNPLSLVIPLPPVPSACRPLLRLRAKHRVPRMGGLQILRLQ